MTATRAVEAPPKLSQIELTTGMVFGSNPDDNRFPTPVATPTVMGALDRAILPALQRPPCLVSFSGGRDSSAVLAVAANIARREGLPPPIPATNVFPHSPASDESGWQERVIRTLGLTEWVRIEHTDELDLIGPYAKTLLRRHGLVWPFNAHFHIPLLVAARDGSLLTGVGGDELFAASERSRLAAVRAGLTRRSARDLARIGLSHAPAWARRAVHASRSRIEFAWLRPHACRLATRTLARWAVEEPQELEARLRWVRRSRYLGVATKGLALAADDAGAQLVHPLLSTEVWSAVAAAAPAGFAGRTEGMRRLFGDLLPDEICARGTKAFFDDVFWTERTRAFAHHWNGGGVPTSLVDSEALSDHWRAPMPAANSFTLLQAAWLASQGVNMGVGHLRSTA